MAGTGVRLAGKKPRSNWRRSVMARSCYETAPTTVISSVSVSEHSTLLITLASSTTKVGPAAAAAAAAADDDDDDDDACDLGDVVG